MIMGFILELGLMKVSFVLPTYMVIMILYSHYSFEPLQAIFSFITMQLQFCSVFFTFSLGTRTHYFGRTILHGGAKVQTSC
jgi:callose synthase